MENIYDKIYTVEVAGEDVECLVDVFFNHGPYDISIKVYQIDGAEVNAFGKEYITEVAGKIHEKIFDELEENKQSKIDSYDEGDR